jgi:16S rRNA (cytidine1402-2'-O)-methyltransferase
MSPSRKKAGAPDPGGATQRQVEAGTLYVVATPIGNLGDLSPRASAVLAEVDLIAAEDTRHTGRLLRAFGIGTPMVSCHEFNERQTAAQLISRLREGQAVALVSDAGTPLVSDPGYRLVSRAHEQGIPVVPVPGPSAVTAALSSCGLPVARFSFEGYLPERASERRTLIEGLAGEARTLVFFEAPHRVQAALADLAAILGDDRPAAIARELTKRYETVRRGTLGDLGRWLQEDAEQRRGEFVLVVGGAEPEPPSADEARRLLKALLPRLSVRDAAAVASDYLGTRRNEMYRLAVELAASDEA